MEDIVQNTTLELSASSRVEHIINENLGIESLEH